MKLNLTNTILYVALGICLLLAMVFCLQAHNKTGELRTYNSRVSQINAWKANVQSLALDCVEYSKKNGDIVPILESVGLIGNKPMTTTGKPAAK